MDEYSVSSLMRGAVSAAASKRILERMGHQPSKIESVLWDDAKSAAEVKFRLSGPQVFRMMLTGEHYLNDYFYKRWQDSFDYEFFATEDPSLVVAHAGGQSQRYWIKIHGSGNYQCDCPDWIAQHEVRGFAVCKHCIGLGVINEVSITEMLAAQTTEENQEVA